MTEFRTAPGFEDVWRPVARTRFQLTPTTLKIAAPQGGDMRARLQRVVAHTPEVVVSVTGRLKNRAGLVAHWNYVSREGRLDLEDRDGNTVTGRAALKELAGDWAAATLSDARLRSDASVSLSIVLSMPPTTDPAIVKDAARAFAQAQFADRFDYVFVLHTDVDHPHVHLDVRASGELGPRLKPWKTDLALWRQDFAQALRDRGVEAEATPRRARGLTRRSEHAAMRRLRETHEAGLGEPARHMREAYLEAAKVAFQGQTAPTIYEQQLLERQTQIRSLYFAQAKLLQNSKDPEDQKLGQAVEAFVRSMPEPDSQRLAFARELRAANDRLRSRDDRHRPDLPPDKDRDR